MSLLRKPSERDDYRVINKEAWAKIKSTEIERGAKVGKIKEKIV